MFQFLPTAAQKDFDAVPGLPEAWHAFISGYFEDNLYGKRSALRVLQKWGRSDSDLRFYNPASVPIPAGSQAANVVWGALPTSYGDFGGDTGKLYRFLDRPKASGERVQDEYCEWVVTRNAAGKITRVVFTSEPPDYYQFLYDGMHGVPPSKTRALLVELYRARCGTNAVKLAHLHQAGEYDWNNRWNVAHAVHMNQRNNTLYAQVNIAALACILRQRNGKLLTGAAELIECADYGAAERQSDPAIGEAVNRTARANRFLSLENPVGLYMTVLDTDGWTMPDGTDPGKFWKVLRGKADADPARAMVVRAEFSVPKAKGYTVGEVEIGGVPIAFGAQIAAHLQMRLGVVVSRPTELPPPRAIGCAQDTPTPLSPLSGMRLRGRS